MYLKYKTPWQPSINWLPKVTWKTTEIPCAFDHFRNDPNYKGQPLWLSCNCPKCSITC
jgi:hypothetical protein